MNPSTPAREIKAADLRKNGEALLALLKQLPKGRLWGVLDIRYGLGGWAAIADKTLVMSDYIGYESDQATRHQAVLPIGVDLVPTAFDDEASSHLPRVPDLLLADFNTVTMLKRKELDEALELSGRPEFVIFTDVACSKLHLNYKSYGLNHPDLKAYYDNFAIPGYRLVAFAKQHHAASTSLWRRC